MSEQEQKNTIEQLLNEHKAIDGHISQLMEIFNSSVNESDLSTQTQKLSSLLATLREHLTKHFMLEESEGIISDDDVTIPKTNPAIKVIFSEHPSLTSKIEALCERCENIESVESLQLMKDDFSSFVADLEDHEAKENRIMKS